MNISKNTLTGEKFVVLFIPEPQVGVSLQELKSNIKRLFGMQDKEVNALFNGTPTVIKSGADEDTALMYKRSIEKCGGSCWMEPEQEDGQRSLKTA